MIQTKLKHYSGLPCLAAICILANSAQAGLVAHYKFEETTGTALVDSSGNGYNGTVTNPSSTGSLNVTGIIGSAYQPGSNNTDYGNRANGTTDFGISGNNARTISLWFNTSSFGGTTDQFRLLGIGVGAAQESFDIVAEGGTNAGGSNRVGLRYGNGNVYYDADNSDTAFAINSWYHLAVVYDGTNLDLETIGTASDGLGLSFYVNGALVNTAGGNLNNSSQVLLTAANANFAFGARNDLAQFANYPGLLDDVQVYNEALSASAVSSLYNNPGTTAIPEPSAFALLTGCFGLSLMFRRRA